MNKLLVVLTSVTTITTLGLVNPAVSSPTPGTASYIENVNWAVERDGYINKMSDDLTLKAGLGACNALARGKTFMELLEQAIEDAKTSDLRDENKGLFISFFTATMLLAPIDYCRKYIWTTEELGDVIKRKSQYLNSLN